MAPHTRDSSALASSSSSRSPITPGTLTPSSPRRTSAATPTLQTSEISQSQGRTSPNDYPTTNSLSVFQTWPMTSLTLASQARSRQPYHSHAPRQPEPGNAETNLRSLSPTFSSHTLHHHRHSPSLEIGGHYSPLTPPPTSPRSHYGIIHTGAGSGSPIPCTETPLATTLHPQPAITTITTPNSPSKVTMEFYQQTRQVREYLIGFRVQDGDEVQRWKRRVIEVT